MSTIANFLLRNELLLLFITILFGILLGRVQVKGVKLGVAGVLFAGLGLSAWLKPTVGGLVIAPEIRDLGLVLFVYTVGLTSAPGFFSAFKSKGLQLNVAVLVSLVVAAGACLGLGRWWGLEGGSIAGIFAGAVTNTPALAAASDRWAASAGSALLPVIAYSVTYPFGVLGALLSMRVFLMLQKPRFAKELEHARAEDHAVIGSRNCVVTNPAVFGRAIGELRIRDEMGVVLSRLLRGQELLVPTKYTRLERDDLITVVGPERALEAAVPYFGELSEERLDHRRDRVDMRRILVSKQKFVGRALSDLKLDERFNAQVTRLRRADLDLVPSGDLRLEVGDRLRVVAPRENLAAVAAYFGDSEREMAAVDFVGLAVGLTLGLLLARVPIVVFGTHIELGIAGGPLLVALALGRLGRTGPLAWSMPFEVNTTLRELGLLLFLAGVGVTAGGKLMEWVNWSGLVLFCIGVAVTLVTSGVGLFLLHVWCKAPIITSLGASSGLQTQPATLAAAYELSGRSEQIYVAYALTYPISMIGKILLAQLLAAVG